MLTEIHQDHKWLMRSLTPRIFPLFIYDPPHNPPKSIRLPERIWF